MWGHLEICEVLDQGMQRNDVWKEMVLQKQG